MRNARLLAKTLGDALVQDADSDGKHAARAAFRALIFFALLVAIGTPAMALLRPVTGGPYGVILLASALLVGAWVVGRRARGVEAEFRTGAEHIASVLTRNLDEGQASVDVVDAALLPGLDHVVRLELAGDAFAVGRTLAQVNLRARTGATVVAVHRIASQGCVMPTGTEPLYAGDVLALAGTDQAVANALELLRRGTLQPEIETVS